MKLTSDQHITKAEGRSSDVLEDHHYRSHLPIERPSQRPLLDRIDLDRKQLRGISVRLGVFGDVLRRFNTSHHSFIHLGFLLIIVTAHRCEYPCRAHVQLLFSPRRQNFVMNRGLSRQMPLTTSYSGFPQISSSYLLCRRFATCHDLSLEGL